jgi:dCMP deaminase
MIIGLTGKNASGKGEVAKFLMDRGFIFMSREKHGPGVLAERIMETIGDTSHYVIDSFRNPSEVEAFRRRSDFLLWSIEASARMRFDRIKARARESDPMTFAHFDKVEKREAKNQDPNKQNLDDCQLLTDSHVSNNATLEALYRRLVPLTKKALASIPRPSWDEYFMRIAQVVAKRSNCLKRKVAAVIVKDGRIISTGYNGTPRHTKNCYQGGCPRCNQVGPSGHGLTECFCSHGEENAIVQAAYHGIAIKDSTLYTTFSPCLLCTKMIINSGIQEVVYNQSYSLADNALGLLKEADVKLRKIEL